MIFKSIKKLNNNESLLKKEFRQSDVERVRNLVNKDYTRKTKLQVGYQKKFTRHKEGDVWEENGKKWTIKNGIKQNITKLDKVKKLRGVHFTKKSNKSKEIGVVANEVEKVVPELVDEYEDEQPL